jgi:hypothetical protein
MGMLRKNYSVYRLLMRGCFTALVEVSVMQTVNYI